MLAPAVSRLCRVPHVALLPARSGVLRLECRVAPPSPWRALPLLLFCQVRHAGHSKWAKIHRAKGANDARRAVVFTKAAAAIKAAVQAGGADATFNTRLQGALDRAKEAGVPRDVIDRALESGSTSAAAEQLLFEGRGPSNAGLIIEALSDNRKRTTSAVRSLLVKSGGELQSTGKVSYDFDYHGRVGVARDAASASASASSSEEPWEDRLFEAALGAGALDVEFDDAGTAAEAAGWGGEAAGGAAAAAAAAHVVCEALAVYKVRDALLAAGFAPVSTSQARVPRSTVSLEAGSDAAVAFEALLDALEEHPDVSCVWHNAEVEGGGDDEEEGEEAR